jgi:DNA gyrase/topoisomerase IV subunit B
MAKQQNAVVDGTPEYTAENIQVLKGLEAVRKRTGLFLCSSCL